MKNSLAFISIRWSAFYIEFNFPYAPISFIVACRCSLAGSLTPVCNQTTGNCFCKANSQGSKCESCKPRTFSLTASNPDGCQSCYGFGHLVSCVAARHFFNADFVSNFTCKCSCVCFSWKWPISFRYLLQLKLWALLTGLSWITSLAWTNQITKPLHLYQHFLVF